MHTHIIANETQATNLIVLFFISPRPCIATKTNKGKNATQ
ncbi:hypothetical protein JCM19232_4948 [Vibrio ishigakensis]|uniref:Uncharacterized protein n=1 Tax=Vibrio ishigakensis TaxID=1481914 RepID=A0A0B8PQP8_9VIBR|nr:hypothetical protein JCM19232_4948 [Vibrio ishigakensis]